MPCSFFFYLFIYFQNPFYKTDDDLKEEVKYAITHDSNLGPDIEGAEYSCESRTKYPDDETDEDSDRDDVGCGDTLEEKFQHAAFLGQEWDAAMIEAGETPLGPDTEEDVLEVTALTPHDKVCNFVENAMVLFQFLHHLKHFYHFLLWHCSSFSLFRLLRSYVCHMF